MTVTPRILPKQDGGRVYRKMETRLFSWGANSYGQLCFGHKNDVSSPENVDTGYLPESIATIQGGGGHTAVITESRELFMCGWNNKGQLGLGDTQDRSVLCHVQGLGSVRQVSCGWNHTLVFADAGFYVWGSNAFGQLGTGKLGGQLTSPVPCQNFPNEQVVSIAAGLRHSLVVLADGSVWAWGANKKGQLGVGKMGSNCATPQQVLFPDGLQQTIIEVVAGSHHSAALTSSGQVFSWGSNQHGQCGRPPEKLSKDRDQQVFTTPQLIGGLFSNVRVAQLKTGWSHLLVISEDVQVFSWGRADYGQLGVGDEVVQQGFCSEPTEITHVRGAKQVVCGAEHNMALLDSGSILTWGWNEHGICGTGDETLNMNQPEAVAKLGDHHISVIGCGGGHSFAFAKR